MSQQSKIEWTDATWNPVTGCTPIAAGCVNCYAKRMAETRLRGRCGYPADEPFRVTFHPDKLNEPLRWKKPRRVFVCSMGDLFHADVPAEWLGEIFEAMARAKRHTFIVLTKRPRRMYDWIGGESGAGWMTFGIHMPNVWLGTSASTQKDVDENVRWLCFPGQEIAVRFLSLEPMLEPVDLRHVRPWFSGHGRDGVDVLRGGSWGDRFTIRMAGGGPGYVNHSNMPTLDWVIVGCESGPGRRPCKLEWVRAVRDQCVEAGVPLFVKQLDLNGYISHSMDEWPKDLRIRQWPGETDLTQRRKGAEEVGR